MAPMASSTLRVVVACLACTALAGADTNVVAPVNGNSVPVASVGDVQSGPTTRSGDTTISEPDQTFTADHLGVNAVVGASNGVPEDTASFDPNGFEQGVGENTADPAGDVDSTVGRTPVGRRRTLLSGRKMLGDLDLSGDGVSAGNDEAGVAANGYGHGVFNDDAINPSGTHVQPHGVDGTVTADGTDTTAGAEVNPDCVGTAEGFNEGPDCVGVTGK